MAKSMIALGTRPEIIKMAPVIKEFQRLGMEFTLVFSNQHYENNLSQQFFQELGLPDPDYYLKNGDDPGNQIGEMFTNFKRIIQKEKPRVLLVEGDTNSVLAAALAANKQHIQLAHIESGLRSFDLRMPEEHNRRLVDHISHYLFAPTAHAANNLKNEAVWGHIYVTGNTVIDSCLQHLPIAERMSTIRDQIRFSEYLLVTFHRAENVDNSTILNHLVESLIKAPINIIFPIHPRTVKRLQQFNLWNPLCSSEHVQILPPLGYFDFLVLMKHCRFILTDSGGIQEEATAPPIRKKVLVTRRSTERPEAVDTGFAEVVGTKDTEILETITHNLEKQDVLPAISPFGKGDAGKKICDIILKEISRND